MSKPILGRLVLETALLGNWSNPLREGVEDFG